MSHARCNVAARTTPEKLKAAALASFPHVEATSEPAQVADSFDGVLDFCQPRTEDLGGEGGGDAWYLWTVGPWALAELSRALGVEVVVCAIDSALDYAVFSLYAGGQVKRHLLHENGEYEAVGLPVQAERGRPLVDFSEEEADRIWTSYGLPTFEYAPEEGRFECIALRRKE
jgi:hypothetical protein